LLPFPPLLPSNLHLISQSVLRQPFEDPSSYLPVP
jgi:hypothetical protein